MSERLEKSVMSSDGIHMLKGIVYLPDSKPKGIFHAVHGMAEHIGRYETLLSKMADEGYISFGYDHLGHRNTVLNDDELGFIAHKDGWKLLVSDVSVFADEIRNEYGSNLPYILFGHSMGSFIVRLAAINVNPDKLIVMGTGGPNPVAGLGIGVANTIRFFRGEKHHSKLIYSMAFGSYNKNFTSENDSNAWLSVNRENRRLYNEDKYCGFMFTVSAMADLIRLNKASNEKTWFTSVDRQMPILLLSGSEDPVGENRKGVQKVYDILKASGSNVFLKFYDGFRHEILNEECRGQVISDMLEFVTKTPVPEIF